MFGALLVVVIIRNLYLLFTSAFKEYSISPEKACSLCNKCFRVRATGRRTREAARAGDSDLGECLLSYEIVDD